MKVLDLQCTQQHSFEGWFGSEDDFQSQLSRGLIACPLCSSVKINKMLSAPRINLGKAIAPVESSQNATKNVADGPLNISSGSNFHDENAIRKESSNKLSNLPMVTPTTAEALQKESRPDLLSKLSSDKVSPETAAAMQAAWLEVAKHVIANTEDVGSSFAAEARKIHYGEADERAIRGQATPDQTRELLEEGIDVLPLPIPESLKRPLN